MPCPLRFSCFMVYPRYRRRKRRRPKERFRVPEGRTYADFCALPEQKRLSAVELDCVEGVRTDTKVLLTMLFKRTSFLLVLVLEEHTQTCVEDAFDMLKFLLGDRFASTLPLLLADRGHEFQNHERIERGGHSLSLLLRPLDERTRKVQSKTAIAKLRRIIPKGVSIDRLTRQDAAIVTSHINSMPRASLGGASPFDLAQHLLPAQLLEGLGLEHTAPDDVVLRPSLLAGR